MIAVFVAAALLAMPRQASEGERLFDVHCSSCHGMYLQGSAYGPPLIGTGAGYVDFMLRTGRMPAAVPWEQTMMKAPQFRDAQIRALVSYVSHAGEGSPILPKLAGGNAEHGRELFAENCEQCHGVTAHGASVGFSNVAPSLMSVAPEQIAEAVRNGPGVMPKFGSDVIAAHDLDDVVGYVALLQQQSHKNNPGGFQLANVGPVAEGFVAWVFGIGLLVLLCRRIGSTD